MFFQTTQSLPNAVNATLSFGAVLFAMLYCVSARRGLLLASAAFFAVALNFKLDAVILAAAPGMAICYVLLRRGVAVALKDSGFAAITAFVVLAAGKPAMLLDPVMDARERYHMLFGIAGGAAHSSFDLSANWNALLAFLNLNLLWPGAGHYAGLVVATVVLLAVAPDSMMDTRARAAGLRWLAW